MSRPHPALLSIASGNSIQEVDDPWSLLRSAHEHRMTGLLWKCIQNGEIDGPQDWVRTVAQTHLTTRLHHQKLWASLERITHQLGGAGIEFATFKGVTSEARWYDDEGERPSGDIDLWISPAHIGRFEDVVRLLQPNHPLADSIQGLVNRGYLQVLPIGLGDGIAVDLHADLFKLGIPSIAAESIWARTESLRIPSGPTVRVLDAETSLIHFLLHLNVDRFARLNRVTDVLRVLERIDLDWSAIDELVRAEGLEVPVYMSLHAALRPFDRRVPVDIPSGPAAWLWNMLWPEGSRLLGKAGARWRLRQRWIPFLARRRRLEAVRWLAKRSLPPSEVLSYYHPDTSGPYLWRVFASRVRFQRDWHRRWTEDEIRADAPDR